MLRNTSTSWGLIAKLFHWVIALLIITMLGVGLYMSGLPMSPDKLNLYALHKSTGVVVLTLMTLRLLWRLNNVIPHDLPTHKKWEMMLADLVHPLIYMCVFIMPISGWLMSSAKGFSVSVFGLFTLPDLIKPDQQLAEQLVQLHEFTAYTLMGILALHVTGALKHHLIDKDSTLRRMWFVLALLIALPASAQAAEWKIDRTHSTLTFEGTQMGAPFTGSFKNFDGQITFDPAQLANSKVVITTDMKSVTTNSTERDQHIGGPVWLDSAQFPQAKFETTGFEKSGTGYIAHGRLTLHGISLPLNLPFTLQFSNADKAVHMLGETTLDRINYGVGSGEWANPKTVGTQVKVKIDLTATAQ